MKNIRSRHAYLTGFLMLSLAILACSMPGPREKPDTEETLRVREINLALTGTALALQVQSVKVQPPPANAVIPTLEAQPTQTETTFPSPTATEIVHTISPGEPGWVNRRFNDTSSKN